MHKRICAVSLALALGLAGAVQADEVTDQIDEALKAYQSGNMDIAVAGLEAAATLIRQQKAEQMASFLPKPLEGWTAEAAETAVAGAAMMGGGTTVSRSYHREDGASINVNIVADSPMIQGMAMMFGNPMFLGGAAKLQVIDGRKTLYNKEDNSFQVMLDNRVLVSVQGSGEVTMDTLKAYYRAVDFEGVQKSLR